MSRSGSWIRYGKRWAIMARHNHTCVYCDKPADTLDHLTPSSRGGSNKYTNLVAACRSCNSSKGAATLSEYVTDVDRLRAIRLARKRRIRHLTKQAANDEVRRLRAELMTLVVWCDEYAPNAPTERANNILFKDCF